MNIDTFGRIELTELDIDGENLEHANYYLPSPTSQLRAILGGLQVRYEDFIFIDVGSGKGGALLLASEFPFRKIIGVEFSHELNEIAQENVRHYGSESQKCKDLEAICIDAALYPIPPKPSVFYFFNPFKEIVMRKVLGNIQNSLRDHPRQVYIIYNNPVHGAFLDRAEFLEKVESKEKHCIYRVCC